MLSARFTCRVFSSVPPPLLPSAVCKHLLLPGCTSAETTQSGAKATAKQSSCCRCVDSERFFCSHSRVFSPLQECSGSPSVWHQLGFPPPFVSSYFLFHFCGGALVFVGWFGCFISGSQVSVKLSPSAGVCPFVVSCTRLQWVLFSRRMRLMHATRCTLSMNCFSCYCGEHFCARSAFDLTVVPVSQG